MEPPADTQMLHRYLRQLDGICASHTSGAPRTNFAEWSLGGWRPLGFVSCALLIGCRLGFQSSSDHISTHMSDCNVFVEEPTREAILDAMKKRRI